MPKIIISDNSPSSVQYPTSMSFQTSHRLSEINLEENDIGEGSEEAV